MDHARHLSSPSPTSPFLFHHSERSFKSNPLTPLLSSTADVSNVDDCFSTSSSSINHQGHNPFESEHNHHQHHHHHNSNNHHHHHQHHSLVDSHQNQQNHHQRHSNQCVIDQDSLTGVDDEDGMHNMLSGSSTSSTSTMPLLTENHSHHSFSRISLEEYSPLSLVEDCDNALTISPTSLACSSHHSFKSSLNGLKMDNLVGDVGVNDDVNDARSLSPSPLSASANHNNLWSTSSTAITQSTSLLNSSSTSFLLSQHHQQLNSLMQQLEPQSLDEPPPLVSNSSTFDLNSPTTNRPSSEPPPGAGFDQPDVECKSLSGHTPQTKPKQTVGRTTKGNLTATQLPVSSRARKSRARSGSAKQSANVEIHNRKQQAATDQSTDDARQLVHNSKLHLHLNHHKKLQELQQRLFGTCANNSDTTSLAAGESKATPASTSTSSACESSQLRLGTPACIKEEPDSSGGTNKDEDTASSSVTESKTKSVRPIRNRRSRGPKNEGCSTKNSVHNNSGAAAKTVTTETAEPDTTTKSSDYIKLADLLSNSCDAKSNNSFIVNSFASTPETNDSDNGEKRLQQIQLQVSPSLTFVANGGTLQPISIQQQQQHVNGSIITPTGATFNNQILCRPQTIKATTGGQLKGIMSNNELLKSGESASCSSQSNGHNNSGTANTTMSSGQAIGAHQIAIQVICQDGTSLVLPVSSPATLNAAVTLTNQHQQLQAALASNANHHRNSNSILPLMSVTNMVAQQQVNTNIENGMMANSSNQSAGCQMSGLAASSPTLAALLDAGSSRSSNNDLSNSNFSSQNFVSTNLLRKLVSGNPAELKRGNDPSAQQGSNLNNYNLTSNVGNSSNSGQSQSIKNVNFSVSNLPEKRIKLESNDCGNIQATLTLIDTQGLIVANGHDKATKFASTVSGNVGQLNTLKPESESIKQSKIGSTGNRQVDPTQPFRCEHCNSTFTRLGNFTRHKKIHTVPTKVSIIVIITFC